MFNFRVFTESQNSFEGQLPEEKTLAVLRMHWFYLFGTGVLWVFTLIPLTAMFIFAMYIEPIELSLLVQLIASLTFLFWWYWAFYQITMYLLNVWIVTDRRIISSTQQGFFSRKVSELHISKIQDVSVRIDGMFGTMLDFGKLDVQTAGAEHKFILRNIPEPMKVKNTIMSLHRGDQVRHNP